jgi:hypothetical protein
LPMPSWTSVFSPSGVAEFVYRIRSTERDEFRGGHTSYSAIASRVFPFLFMITMLAIYVLMTYLILKLVRSH